MVLDRLCGDLPSRPRQKGLGLCFLIKTASITCTITDTRLLRLMLLLLVLLLLLMLLLMLRNILLVWKQRHCADNLSVKSDVLVQLEGSSESLKIPQHLHTPQKPRVMT